MRAVVKYPGKPAEITDIKGDLSSLQDIVGGWITTFFIQDFEENGITGYANDEGLLEGLEPNIHNGYQTIVGPVVFTGHNNEGETIGLTVKQAQAVLDSQWVRAQHI